MKQFLVAFLVIMLGAFASPAANAACTSDQIDVAGDGSNCQTAKFSLTTTSLSANDTFGFYMSAMGTFYVDCGDDGTLSGDGVSGDTITRTGTTETLYTCTYSTGGVKTIRMGGVATGYNTEYRIAAVAFICSEESQNFVSGINGSLGAIFPTLGNATYNKPSFANTFYGCNNLTSIPENLFSGVTGARNDMFISTFSGLSNLISIPANLFGGISGSARYLFLETFAQCASLVSIPENLFRGVTGGGGAFEGTFTGCTSLTTIPENLFHDVVDVSNYTFSRTFNMCVGITFIPNNLFASITMAGYRSFFYTFGNTGITSIPGGLFRNITTIMDTNAFEKTFRYCGNLSGYIPPSVFAGLIANGSTYANNMWLSTFDDTNLATTCPTGMVQYITGYEDYWNSKVSCRVTASQTCAAGTYLPAAYNECTACAAGSYCTGGTYDFNASAAQGITACGAGLYSPAGMSNANQCGHILHVGDATLYLHGVKKTTPAMHVRVGNDIFYGNMTTADVPMNVGTTQKLKVKYGGVTYSIYDDTVNVN